MVAVVDVCVSVVFVVGGLGVCGGGSGVVVVVVVE